MSNGFQIDLDTLEQVAGALSKASDNIGTAPAAPQSVDAGNLNDAFTRLIVKLVRDADQISIGLAAASAEIDKTRQDYLTQEKKAQEKFKN
ncbi:hypothetical protein [Actinokineospora iranica]|uniref:Excreted virulence factor EspC, type VII ESX diderm n=1 Tax=Actinokineospora iranica TaxID=1271860 RepID=A0A1G6SA13_9PSEU|nr:hypothetical protein [Actinokineospora iranica]SDD13770.1 hypothetical protein SAMN05216174_107313 [Actinokineospora iranica]